MSYINDNEKDNDNLIVLDDMPTAWDLIKLILKITIPAGLAFYGMLKLIPIISKLN